MLKETNDGIYDFSSDKKTKALSKKTIFDHFHDAHVFPIEDLRLEIDSFFYKLYFVIFC